jgi:hypothetical protein
MTWADSPSSGAYAMRGDMAVAARILEQAPPDALVEPLLPNLWAGIAQESGAPANIRVDSCLALKYAYGQLGIRAELALADLTVREANGDGVLHGTPAPSWNDDVSCGPSVTPHKRSTTIATSASYCPARTHRTG